MQLYLVVTFCSFNNDYIFSLTVVKFKVYFKIKYMPYVEK